MPQRTMPKRAAGSRSVAAELAAWTRTPDGAPRRLPPTARRRASCSCRNAGSSLVGGGEVGHRAGEPQRRQRAASVATRERLGRVARCRAAPSRSPASRARRVAPSAAAREPRAARRTPRARRPRRRGRPPRRASSSSRQRAHHQQRRVDAARAQLCASAAVATASQLAPPRQRGARGRHRAVPVAVGLDDRAQPRGAGRRGQRARSCARSRRGRRGRAPGRTLIRRGVSASSTSTRVTTPTSRPCSITGRRLCFLRAIVRAASSTVADGSIVTGSSVIMSLRGRRRTPCAAAPRSGTSTRGRRSRRTARSSAAGAGPRSLRP